MKHLDITISGQVQGVGFRYSTKQMADALSVSGYVKNMADGTVYIEAEASDSDLEKFVEWCHQGPGFASVENVKTSEGDIAKYNNFEIRH